MLTSPCDVDPLTPHFLYSKTGVYRGINFLIFAQNIDCGYSCTHNLCFEQKYENNQNISTENCHFYSREKSLYVAWACFRNAKKIDCSQQYLYVHGVVLH